jgi:hypothetical protein
MSGRVSGRSVFTAAVLLIGTGLAYAVGKGQGAIVLNDNAPVYVTSTGEKLEAKAMRGDCVGTTGGMLDEYTFREKNGRVHVTYFTGTDQKGIERTAWMNPSDLATFMYDCCFGENEPGGSCKPIGSVKFMVNTWNNCFVEARDKKLAELKVQWAGGGAGSGAGAAPAAPKKSNEKAITNEDVIALVKADLGDEIVIDKIRSAPGDKLDTSTDALIRLKKAGVSKAVIDAMVKRKAGA